MNEVWAGTPVNMAVKLSSVAGPNEVAVSERVFSDYQQEREDPAAGAAVVLRLQGEHVKGGEKMYRVGGSIVGLRLSTFSENVLANWPAEMSRRCH